MKMQSKDPSVLMRIEIGNDCPRLLDILTPDNDQSIKCQCNGDKLEVSISQIKYNSIFNVCNEILRQIEIFERVKKIE